MNVICNFLNVINISTYPFRPVVQISVYQHIYWPQHKYIYGPGIMLANRNLNNSPDLKYSLLLIPVYILLQLCAASA